jgi:hypothetical protein
MTDGKSGAISGAEPPGSGEAEYLPLQAPEPKSAPQVPGQPTAAVPLALAPPELAAGPAPPGQLAPVDLEEQAAARALAAEQLRKLRLEGDELEAKLRLARGWSARLGNFSSVTPIITVLLATAGFLAGIYQYNDQQQKQSRQAYETKEKEFKKPLWEKQLALYLQVTHAAAAIASSTDPKAAARLHRELLPRLQGDLIVVADTQVIQAAIDYEKAYTDYVQEPTKQEDLLSASRTLARACRNSLVRTFKADLGTLKDYHSPRQE